MNSHTYINIGYVAFLSLLVVGVRWFLSLHAPLSRKVVVPVIAGAVGFAFHAFLFFTGIILLVQLGFIACIIGQFWFWSIPEEET